MNTCRHIKLLRELKVSEMSDEEVLKAFVDRIKCKAAILIYLQEDGKQSWWFGRYRKGGYPWLTQMKLIWQKATGFKLHVIKEK